MAIGLLGEGGKEREESCADKASMERVRCFGTGELELSDVAEWTEGGVILDS